MSSNLIPIKAFLGKYYSELMYSSAQDKYNKVNLNKFFEQRFYIQNNKTQMIIDPALKGLIMIVSGNEIHISKDLYDHPSVEVTNSMENQGQQTNNPKSLYTPDVFSTIAYLVCQNHTMLKIEGEVDEPIYIRYKSDFETFFNSVVIVSIGAGIDVEIVEEYESHSALNAVTNYVLHENSRMNVSSFYHNTLSAISFCLRNVIIQENAKFNHTLFGKGSSNVLDETKILIHNKGTAELLGCINPGTREFHSIVGVQPAAQDYTFYLDQRHVVSGRGKVTFTPIVVGHLPSSSHANVSSLILDIIPENSRAEKIVEFLAPVMDRATLERMTGVERFYNNKTKFLQFQ